MTAAALLLLAEGDTRPRRASSASRISSGRSRTSSRFSGSSGTSCESPSRSSSAPAGPRSPRRSRRPRTTRRRAEALAAELGSRLAQIETELANLRESARRDAEAEHAALLKQTEEDAARFLARASTDVDNRVRAARAELTAYAGDLAVEVAREILAKNVTAEDEKRLVAEGVAELSARAKG